VRYHILNHPLKTIKHQNEACYARFDAHFTTFGMIIVVITGSTPPGKVLSDVPLGTHPDGQRPQVCTSSAMLIPISVTTVPRLVMPSVRKRR